MPQYIISDLDGLGGEIRERAHCSESYMGRKATGSCIRCIGHNRLAHHRQMYHGGGQATHRNLAAAF